MADTPERVKLFHYQGKWWVATDLASVDGPEYINTDAVRALAEEYRERSTRTADKSGWPWNEVADRLDALVDGREGDAE